MQKEKTHQYRAHNITVVVKKSPVGTYTATAEITKEGSDRTIELLFPPDNDQKTGAPMADLPCLPGAYLTKNPYNFIAEYCHGMIDGMLKNTNQEAINMRPRTNPTPEQTAQMREAIKELIDLFGAAGIAHISGQSTETITNWAARGRISATQAHKICQHPAVKQAGFTREKLRPDVQTWVQMDYPAAPKTGYEPDNNA